MTNRFIFIAASVLIAGTACVPLGAALAQQVSVQIDTPGIGIRFGTPYPYPVYGPAYPAPVYAPPVTVAPAPVYYPAPSLLVAPPRMLLPAPIYYRQPWFVPPGHAKRYWRTTHHHYD